MHPKNLPSLIILFSVLMYSCNNEKQNSSETSAPSLENLIPKPVSVKTAEGSFEITSSTLLFAEDGSAETLRIGRYLGDKLKPATGFELKMAAGIDSSKKGNIILALISGDSSTDAEGYELAISKDQLKISAHNPAGLFYGVQTVLQLLPPSIESRSKQKGPWLIGAGTIVDQPEYAWRGSMLDVARHFFDVDDVKRYIDLLVFYKMNLLHLHLSDDQGWRIEIKSWPNLTKHGGSTEVGGGKGGFYTQEQYKDIVQYAQERFITVIPEIDMPGHTNAALASYAELNCNDSATKLYTGTEVGFSTLCTKKEITYKFIDDVLRELSAITPGPYLHIGGDESHATKKEDYIPFMTRVQQMVKTHGKLAIGWDEIALSTLQPNTVAQFWADSANSTMAVKQGAKIMMSPAKRAYLDMQYDSTSKLGLHWAAYIEVDDAYNWDPAKYVSTITRENILGVEAPLWSETVANMEDIEWLVFPRLPGYAEIGWSPPGSRSWDEYRVRLGKHGARMKAMGINYYKSKKVDWVE